jgi:hypothetical protein
LVKNNANIVPGGEVLEDQGPAGPPPDIYETINCLDCIFALLPKKPYIMYVAKQNKPIYQN